MEKGSEVNVSSLHSRKVYGNTMITTLYTIVYGPKRNRMGTLYYCKSPISPPVTIFFRIVNNAVLDQVRLQKNKINKGNKYSITLMKILFLQWINEQIQNNKFLLLSYSQYSFFISKKKQPNVKLKNSRQLILHIGSSWRCQLSITFTKI